MDKKDVLMRVLAKSLLDLIPLAIVTIIISVIASQSLEELSLNYDEIITEDLSVVSRLNLSLIHI